MIVLKFGGTSVGNADRVRDAASIIEAQSTPRAAVVSAASGVTNLLLDAAAAAAAGNRLRAGEIAATIREKHLGVAAGIGGEEEQTAALATLDQLHAALDEALDSVAAAGTLSKRDSDRIVSTG